MLAAPPCLFSPQNAKKVLIGLRCIMACGLEFLHSCTFLHVLRVICLLFFTPPIEMCRDWGVIIDQLSELNFNMPSREGATPLQLAVWNGQAATLSSLLGPWPLGAKNELAVFVQLNQPAAVAGPAVAAAGTVARSLGTTMSELDLAITKQHLQCSRLLCRAGAVTRELCGVKGAEELLCRMIVLGDGLSAAKLLLGDGYQLQVTPPIMELLSRIKYPEACTFTFAQVSDLFYYNSGF